MAGLGGSLSVRLRIADTFKRTSRLVPSRSLRPSARFCKPPNMQMRRAMLDDGAMIARLHTESWRSAYKPFLNPNFLSGPIEEDRLRAWTSRLMRRPANETVIVAEIENEPIGFVCAVGGEDDRWGTLIDNLHVLPSSKGQGVGAALLGAAAEWSAAIYPPQGSICGASSRMHPPAASTSKGVASPLNRSSTKHPAEVCYPRCASIGPIRLRHSMLERSAYETEPNLLGATNGCFGEARAAVLAAGLGRNREDCSGWVCDGPLAGGSWQKQTLRSRPLSTLCRCRRRPLSDISRRANPIPGKPSRYLLRRIPLCQPPTIGTSQA